MLQVITEGANSKRASYWHHADCESADQRSRGQCCDFGYSQGCKQGCGEDPWQAGICKCNASMFFEVFGLVWFVCCEAPRVFLAVVYVYFLFYFFPRKHEGLSLMPRARSLLFQVIVG